MARKRRRSGQRKLELISLIDVIFLLLIFFMVTLNIIPAMTRDEPIEASFDVPVPRSTEDKVDVIVQLQRVPELGNRTRYLVFDKTLGQQEDDLLGSLRTLSDNGNFAGLAAVLRNHRILDTPAELKLSKQQTVIIRCPDLASYGDVLAVVDRCQQFRGVKVHLASGSVADLAGVLSFDNPDTYGLEYPRD